MGATCVLPSVASLTGRAVYRLLRENGKKNPKASTKLTFTQCWVISLLSKKLHCNIAKKNIYKALKDFYLEVCNSY